MLTAEIKPEALDVSIAVVPQLYLKLRDLILTGELVPGVRLSETDIAEAYSVSRQPVREAFIKLVEDGLLEIRPQRGSFVRKIVIQQVMDARFIREAIEAEIVRLAAVSANSDTITNLRHMIAAQKSVAHDGRAFIALDDSFHMMLATVADKLNVWHIMVTLNVQKDRVRQLAAQDYPIDRLITQHETIVDAIARKDPDAAEAAMRHHLREVLADLPKIAAKHANYFESP
ncbi:MAG: GntR family transcriptional regulator [Deltaproteobacteria bacterium]